MIPSVSPVSRVWCGYPTGSGLVLLDLQAIEVLLCRNGFFAALARILHEGFYYNRQYASETSLTAGGFAARLAWRLGGFVTNLCE